MRTIGAVLVGWVLGTSDAAALELEASSLVVGTEATFVATGATPGATVAFAAGITTTTGCAVPGVIECLKPGVELGVAVANPSGTAVLGKELRAGTPTGAWAFQAIERGATPSASPVLRETIRPADDRVAAR